MDNNFKGNRCLHSASEASEAHSIMSDLQAGSAMQALAEDGMDNDQYQNESMDAPQVELAVSGPEEILDEAAEGIVATTGTLGVARCAQQSVNENGLEGLAGNDPGVSEGSGAGGMSGHDEDVGSMTGEVIDESSLQDSEGVFAESAGIEDDLGVPTIYDEAQASDESEGAYSSDDMGDWADANQESEAQASFRISAAKNRGFIDLFIKQGLTHSAMDDIVPLIDAPYKTWKTVMLRIREDSGFECCVKEYPVCPGHIRFYEDAIT